MHYFQLLYITGVIWGPLFEEYQSTHIYAGWMSYFPISLFDWSYRRYCSNLKLQPSSTVKDILERHPSTAQQNYCRFSDHRINEEKLIARLAWMLNMEKSDLRYTWQQGEYFVYDVHDKPKPDLTEVSGY